MMHFIDTYLDGIPMYRLVRNVLLFLVGVGAVLGFIGFVPYSGFTIIISAALMLWMAWFTNLVFAKAFGAPPHEESAYITGLILTLIITPFHGLSDLPLYLFSPVIAIASKYIISARKQHIFNPAAIAVVITGLAFDQAASWWIGTTWMVPAVLIGGFLIVRKIRRWDVVFAFLGTALVILEIAGFLRGTSLLLTFQRLLTLSPMLFFASVMLTEPLTMPPRHRMRIAFGLLTGILFYPQLHVGNLYSTPELALVVSNGLFYMLTRRGRYVLELKEKLETAPGVEDFLFTGPRFAFQPGQYMEWMLPHYEPDNRGLRRYFTVASSPTEATVRLGVKFYEPGSSYKRALHDMRTGDRIIAYQRDGDFTLPKDVQQPCVFIAGGIGITPFRSMLQYLIDKNEQRPITLFAAHKTAADIVYKDIFDAAEQKLGIRTYYALSDEKAMPSGDAYIQGRLTVEALKQRVPNYAECVYYLSGPNAMVKAFVKLITGMGVPRKHIKTDYFPGFA